MKMTTTKPLEYIIINGIRYKTTFVEEIQVVTDFNDYLDSLDAEIYNRSLDKFGQVLPLKEFSDLLESEILTDNQLSDLKKYIHFFKEAVKESVEERIFELATKYLNPDLHMSLKDKSLNAVKECIAYHEFNNLTDSQEFINWEDELNELSCKDHSVIDWLNYKNCGLQIEKIN